MGASIKLDGRVTRDPELKYANSGVAIAKFGVATNERVKNKQTDQYEDSEPTFWNCVAFGQMAENICEHLEKGSAIFVTGKIKKETYTAKDGTEKTDYPVTVDEISSNLRWAKPKGQSSSSFQGDAPF